MEQRQLGTAGPHVGAIGLGCSGMSGAFGPSDDAASVATINTALEQGINLIDTADFYGMGHNESLIAKALRGRPREQVIISDKFGALCDPAGRFIGVDGRPEAVKNSLAYSLQRLNTDYIDIYRLARLDPAVPAEETVGAIAELVGAGYIRAIGLSEVGAETIRRAHSTHPICDVQIEYSLFSRGPEQSILPTCRELGVGVTAYGVLSHGLLSDSFAAQPSQVGFRAMAPRFQSGNLEHNLTLVKSLSLIASKAHTTLAQLAIAWVLAQGETHNDIVALVGARTPERLAESLPAAALELNAETLAEIERAIPPGAAAGDRYPTALMTMLDSESPT